MRLKTFWGSWGLGMDNQEAVLSDWEKACEESKQGDNINILCYN